MELLVLLKQEELFKSLVELENSPAQSHIPYQQVNIDKISQPETIDAMLKIYTEDARYNDLYIDLVPYVNQSAVTLQGKFSLHRAYIIFRTLGLRHLTIVNEGNQVTGVITRKDLMGFSMEEKLADKMNVAFSAEIRNVPLSENLSYPT